jgi:hypothetical protein
MLGFGSGLTWALAAAQAPWPRTKAEGKNVIIGEESIVQRVWDVVHTNTQTCSALGLGIVAHAYNLSYAGSRESRQF